MSRALVIAKAPVPGLVKTRLGAEIGMEAAARVAAAALLDTIDACEGAFDECHLSLDGDLTDAWDATELRDRLATWVVHPQRGGSLGERLAFAHADAGGGGQATVQLGMDTPQVTTRHLADVRDAAAAGDAVLGAATDGGWWVLALSDPTAAGVLVDVPMSRSDTYLHTRAALVGSGQTVLDTVELTDVDTAADAVAVAASLDGAASAGAEGRFLRVWREVGP